MLRLLSCLVLLAGLCSSASGQLFPNAPWNKNRVSSSDCPGGVCPVNQAAVNPAPGHWSYPGTIDNHLEEDHGVSTAGMTRQQKLDLHDSLHEGTAPAVRRAPFTSRAGYQTVTVSKSGSYGSCGGTRVNYGSSGGSYSFRVGGFDKDGYLITSIGTTQTQSSQAEVSSLGVRKRKASREAILEAANKAHSESTISSDELRAIRLACKSPRMLATIEDMIIEKAINSGAYSFTLKANGEVDKAAIDWEAIGDFILKIAPIIFKLIELFAILEQANPVQGPVVADVFSPNFVATMAFSGC